MHHTITEHINQDAGYNRGYQAGIKHAWDVLEDAATWYGEQSALLKETKPNKSQHLHDKKMALLWAQMLIKKSKFIPS